MGEEAADAAALEYHLFAGGENPAGGLAEYRGPFASVEAAQAHAESEGSAAGFDWAQVVTLREGRLRDVVAGVRVAGGRWRWGGRRW